MNTSYRFNGTGFPANLLDKDNYRLIFNEAFNELVLNTRYWIPYYLPPWSLRAASKPQYRLAGENLILQITEDQLPWCSEFNGDVKCSSIQTGLYAGPLHSTKGQHRFNTKCKVREIQIPQRNRLPHYGYINIQTKVAAIPNRVSTLWR